MESRHSELTSLRRVAAKAEQADNKVVDYGIDLNRIKFRYEIAGDNAPWKLTQVFDDGSKVFPNGIIQGEAPMVVSRFDAAFLILN